MNGCLPGYHLETSPVTKPTNYAPHVTIQLKPLNTSYNATPLPDEKSDKHSISLSPLCVSNITSTLVPNVVARNDLHHCDWPFCQPVSSRTPTNLPPEPNQIEADLLWMHFKIVDTLSHNEPTWPQPNSILCKINPSSMGVYSWTLVFLKSWPSKQYQSLPIQHAHWSPGHLHSMRLPSTTHSRHHLQPHPRRTPP